MTIKVILIVYSYLLRDKTMTVAPLFQITVGIGGLIRRVVASLLSSFFLREIFFSFLRRAFCSFLIVWKADRISSSCPCTLSVLLGRPSKRVPSALNFRHWAVLCVFLMAGAHLAQFWQSLAEDLLGAEALLSPSGFASWESDCRVSFFSWEACRIPFHLACRTSEAA